MSEACKLDKEKREKLCGLYKETAEFFDQLDKNDVIVKALEESLVDFKTTLQKNIKDIKPKDQYVVLVAGKHSVLYKLLSLKQMFVALVTAYIAVVHMYSLTLLCTT